MSMAFATPELEPYLVLAQELLRHVYADESPTEINTWILEQVHKLSRDTSASARLTWEESFDFYERVMAERARQAALPVVERRTVDWPWPSWNKLIDPLEPGMLAVLAASDGAGKTLYSENIAEYWARRGLHVAFLHFELNRTIMLDRRTVRHSGIPRRTLRVGQLTPQEEVERQRSNDTMRQWPGGICYVHTPGWTMERALAEVHALSGEGLCDVCVVDYLEKAAPSARQLRTYGANHWQREANDVEMLKSFAEQIEIPALLVAQLNKMGKGQSFADMDRTAIRGAGEKTEKANVVILLHRESLEDMAVKVRVDKNTLGPTGSFEQVMNTPRFLVGDVEPVSRRREDTPRQSARQSADEWGEELPI